MTLLDLAEGAVVEIRALPDDPEVAKRMEALGLYVGRRVRFVRAAPFSGPVLVEDEGTGARIMIARSMADDVEVSDERSRRT
jgi:Fe2+ transport system protein FeoA